MDSSKKEKALKIRLHIVLLFIGFSQFATSQVEATVYTDFGHNQVAGVFMKSVLAGDYEFNKFHIEAALESDVIGDETKLLAGLNAKFSREFSVKEFEMEGGLFFIFSPYSEILKEYNWGFLLSTERNYLNIKLGTNFRTYLIPNGNVSENGNLIYDFSYDLKKADNNWNLGASVTNFDHFLIHQETNPMFNIHGRYKINESLGLKAEIWYQTAGALNLHVNYFGTFLRTGLIWKI